MTLPDDAMTITTVQINITESGGISWTSGNQPNLLVRTMQSPSGSLGSAEGARCVFAASASVLRDPHRR